LIGSSLGSSNTTAVYTEIQTMTEAKIIKKATIKVLAEYGDGERSTLNLGTWDSIKINRSKDGEVSTIAIVAATKVEAGDVEGPPAEPAEEPTNPGVRPAAVEEREEDDG
jgi:hypothetical protein